jgi:PIN domain nuclease of toxin-antitoxin system
MSEPIFDITFYGIIQPGMDKEVAINNMAQLFKTTPEKVTPFFAGGRKVVKSRVDEPTANKYRTALEKAGLVIKLEAQSTADIDTSDISAAPVGADVLENPPVVESQPIDDISDITMAEVGADVLENPPVVESQPIDDISDITMAEVGADVLDNPPVVEAQPIGDISGITIAEVGTDMLENPAPEQKAPAPDTSDLSVKDKG